MRYSGVGGQAVMEGVMMKNKDKYAVAVRKPNHEIEVKVSDCKSAIKNEKLRNLPIVRGVVNFIESLSLGMKTLMYSASFFEDEEDTAKKENPGKLPPELPNTEKVNRLKRPRNWPKLFILLSTKRQTALIRQHGHFRHCALP